MDALDKEKFGAFIAELRKEKGLTQQELADRLFLSNKAVSKWERGQSLPDIALLMPLADMLGVSVAELLKGERIPGETMDSKEVDTLLTQALQLSEEAVETKGRSRKRWQTLWWRSLAVSLCGAAFLVWRGAALDELLTSVFLFQGLFLIFGWWTCFGIKETLPTYYDENQISYYTDGVFRLHVTGMRLNNSNWPHIVRVLRVWTVGIPVLYPVLYWFLRPWWGWLRVAVPLLCCMGLLVETAVTGKKHE